MEIISKSADHHFLATLQRLKTAPQGWIVLTFALSRRHHHEDVLRNASSINKYLAELREEAEEQMEFLAGQSQHLAKASVYLFDDNDLVLLASIRTPESKDEVQKIFRVMSERLETGFAEFGYLEHEFYTYHKFSNQKLLAARRVKAYREMADRHKVATIPLRREIRDQPLVQVIEDDRFTASYTASILNREYDMVLSRNGEDAIVQYIDQAPDIVFIDIHLPGLNGHEVLQALKAVDPKIHAVMLSVDTMKDNIVKSAEGGANNFLKKPFSKERLLNIVKSSPYIQGWMRRNSATLA